MQTCAQPECHLPAVAQVTVVAKGTITDEKTLCAAHTQESVDAASPAMPLSPPAGKYVVTLVAFFSDSPLHTVLLQRVGGPGTLRLEFGPVETSSILGAIRFPKPPRPLTHDLIRELASALKGRVVNVRISREASIGGFHEAAITVEDTSGHQTLIACRPSDAICVAVRAQVPMLVSNDLYDQNSDCRGTWRGEELGAGRVLMKGYHSRRSKSAKRTMIIIMLLFAAGVALVALLYTTTGGGFAHTLIVGISAPMLISLLAVLVSLFIGYCRNEVVELLVNEDGVRYGLEVWRWSDIVRLRILRSPYSGCMYLVLHLHSRRSGRALVTDNVLSAEEIMRIKRSTQSFLMSRGMQTSCDS